MIRMYLDDKDAKHPPKLDDGPLELPADNEPTVIHTSGPMSHASGVCVDNDYDMSLDDDPPPGGERDLHYIILHRISIAHCRGFANTPEDVVRFFRTHPDGMQAVANSQVCPYHYIVAPDGDFDAPTPINEIGYHAGRWNRQSIGLALIGDFRDGTPPTKWQYWTMLQIICELQRTRGRMSIVGHDALPHASKSASKVCPGPGLSPKRVAAAVDILMQVIPLD